MIGVVRLWNTVNQMAKTETSGYQTQDEFNRDLASVQTALLSVLAPFYSQNQAIQDILSPFIKSTALSSTKPTDYFRFVSGIDRGYPMIPINVNQVGYMQSSPIRKPTAKRTYYYFEDKQTKFLASGTPAGTMTYIRYPLAAKIVLTPVSGADNDYVTPTADGDLEWNEDAFNFFLYMMLEKLGVETKDTLSIQFSSLGIQKELANI